MLCCSFEEVVFTGSVVFCVSVVASSGVDIGISEVGLKSGSVVGNLSDSVFLEV